MNTECIKYIVRIILVLKLLNNLKIIIFNNIYITQWQKKKNHSINVFYTY